MKKLSSARLASRKQMCLGINKMTAVVTGAVSIWCAASYAGEIHEAAELGDVAKVKACLAQDPKQINSVDAKGQTVLTRAALSGKKELVEFLLEQGATENIFAAAIVGHTGKIAELLKQNPKLVDAKDSSGRAALHWAAVYGQKKAVELLLAAKTNVNLLDENGFTALHWAAIWDKSDVAKVLLANKADTTIKVAKFGWTPLRLAVIHGHVATAETLLKGGADPNLKDGEDTPLLHQAIISGKKPMVELLLANKCDINLKDPSGETPLAEAVEQGNREIIELLRRRGAK